MAFFFLRLKTILFLGSLQGLHRSNVVGFFISQAELHGSLFSLEAVLDLLLVDLHGFSFVALIRQLSLLCLACFERLVLE